MATASVEEEFELTVVVIRLVLFVRVASMCNEIDYRGYIVSIICDETQ